MSNIEKAVYRANVDSHTNLDRTLVTAFDGESRYFLLESVRIARFEREAEFGNHWREYPEDYSIIGSAKVMLEDIDSKKRREYNLATGDRLFVPPRVALKIWGEPGTVIIVCSPRGDREKQTHKYQID